MLKPQNMVKNQSNYSSVTRCKTVIGFHKFELVPQVHNGIELLDEDFSGSERRSYFSSYDLSLDDSTYSRTHRAGTSQKQKQ